MDGLQACIKQAVETLAEIKRLREAMANEVDDELRFAKSHVIDQLENEMIGHYHIIGVVAVVIENERLRQPVNAAGREEFLRRLGVDDK